MPWIRERLVGLSLIVICALLWFLVLPVHVEGQQQSFFPRLALVWIAVFSALTSIFPPRAGSPEDAVADDITFGGEPPPEEHVETFPSVYGLMVVWGLYAVFVGQLGFYLATFLMLATSMYYLGIRKVMPLLLRPTIALLVIYLVLDLGLNFRLPEGFWQ